MLSLKILRWAIHELLHTFLNPDCRDIDAKPSVAHINSMSSLSINRNPANERNFEQSINQTLNMRT
eukprot:6198944-Pleurochrysis_carterae.AAC.1